VSEFTISPEKSIVLAADVEPAEFHGLVQSVAGTGLGGIKIGFEVGLGMGLKRASEIVREADNHISVIYDHQKAGNDIPDTGKNFARAMYDGEVDAAILFPFTGKPVEEKWIKELQDQHIGVIVGAEMTHPGITDFIRERAFREMFEGAVELGVTEFVVPGNKPDKVKLYREFFDQQLGAGNFDLYAPGFVAQGGEISEAGQQAGKKFHAIVGRGIYEAEDPRAATQTYVEQIKGAA
jgi:orotidine-5'-phosphate decarboxylase